MVEGPEGSRENQPSPEDQGGESDPEAIEVQKAEDDAKEAAVGDLVCHLWPTLPNAIAPRSAVR